MNERPDHHVLEEIARLRGIAEEGRRLPLASGRYLILWGCAVATALAVQWIVTMNWFPLPAATLALTWPAIMLGAGLTARHRIFTQGLKSQASLGARVERTVWLFGGGFLALAPISTLLAAWIELETKGSSHALDLLSAMPALTFGVYAIALAASAEIAVMPRLKLYACLSLAFVPVTLLLAGSVWQFAVVALGILLMSVLPGTMMLAAERANGDQ
jgi:hypothetical protein